MRAVREKGEEHIKLPREEFVDLGGDTGPSVGPLPIIVGADVSSGCAGKMCSFTGHYDLFPPQERAGSPSGKSVLEGKIQLNA